MLLSSRLVHVVDVPAAEVGPTLEVQQLGAADVLTSEVGPAMEGQLVPSGEVEVLHPVNPSDDDDDPADKEEFSEANDISGEKPLNIM